MAAITIIMYVLMFVSSLFSGYSYGVAPMISYYCGAGNHAKLKRLVRTSLLIILGISLASVAISIGITRPLVSIFTRPDNPVYQLAVTGNRLCSIALCFIGFNIFSSSCCSGFFQVFCIYAYLPSALARLFRRYRNLACQSTGRRNGNYIGRNHVSETQGYLSLLTP